jgi:gas vesicle protein
MAETFEKYQELKDSDGTHIALEKKLDIAMDMTELLKDVRRRVEAFVKAYEEDIVPEELAAQRMRETGFEGRARVILDDLQNVQSVQDEQGKVQLRLDDVKILLDKFPQQDW